MRHFAYSAKQQNGAGDLILDAISFSNGTFSP
jgi:hypothetical protein